MGLSEEPVDVRSLSAFLETIGSHHRDLVFEPRRDLRAGRRTLYHYTSLDGLIGIVKNHDLWLTHSRFLNDSEEITLGLTMVRDALDEAKKAKKHSSAYLDAVLERTSKPEGVYVCCFCESNNLLSQWRGYGANGIGVSLAFAPKQFVDVMEKFNRLGLTRFWKVFYKEETQRDIIKKAIETYAPSANRGQNVTVLARRAADAIRFFIPTFKNADFQDEQEWRLIFTPNRLTAGTQANLTPEFRTGRSMLIPYYKLRSLLGRHLQPLPLTEVLVGPSVHKQLIKESTETLLKQNGYVNVPVNVSSTTYRP